MTTSAEPLECWVNFYPESLSAFDTEAKAHDFATGRAARVAVHLREVGANPPASVAVTEATIEAAWRAATPIEGETGGAAFRRGIEAAIRHHALSQGVASQPSVAVTEAMVEAGVDAALTATYERLPRCSVVRAILTAALSQGGKP